MDSKVSPYHVAEELEKFHLFCAALKGEKLLIAHAILWVFAKVLALDHELLTLER